MFQASPGIQYEKLCAIYDSLFSSLLNPGRRKVIKAVNTLGKAKVLEVGIGTGLSLPFYSKQLDITGIDISPSMLKKAEQRVQKHRLKNVNLMIMDAEKLAFGEHAFDAVVALYVVSTVNNPQRLIKEISRVCQPGGKIYILNHFSERSSFTESVEKYLMPVTQRIGWKSYFHYENIRTPLLRLIRSQRLNCFGYWRLMEFEKERAI